MKQPSSSPSRTPAVHLFLHLARCSDSDAHRRSPEALGCLPVQGAEINRQGLEGRGCGEGDIVGLHIPLIRQESYTKHPSRLEANCPLLWKGGPCPLSRLSPWGTSGQCTLMPRSSDREVKPELSFHSAPVLPEHKESSNLDPSLRKYEHYWKVRPQSLASPVNFRSMSHSVSLWFRPTKDGLKYTLTLFASSSL